MPNITLQLDIQSASYLEEILGKKVEEYEEDPKSDTKLMIAYKILKDLQEKI